MMNYNQMPTEKIKQRIKELTAFLEGYIDPEAWHEYYKEYSALNAILDERYREENQAAFDAFYAKHIKGRTWKEIHPDDWSFYSDWHKDMYGFRPRTI